VTVPTALERRGDFSQTVDASGNPFPYIRDHLTGLPCNAADTRGCFRDGGVLGRIPQDRLYPYTNQGLTRTGSGVTNLPMLYPEAVQGDMLPTVTFGGGRVGSPVARWSANLTKVAGPHVLKAGFFFQRGRKDQGTFAPSNGVDDFANNVNNLFDSGHPFANAALGIYNTFRQASTCAKPSWRYRNFE
jgi:hypothetical protein